MAIDKANSKMVIVLAVASFVTVFCLVAASSVWSQLGYQNRVLTAKQTAYDRLRTDESNLTQLVNSYESFDSQQTNIIGGSLNGNSGNSGNNAKIILDALPSVYDFPALITSINNLLTSGNYTIGSISGTDSGSSTASSSGDSTPQAQQIPFSFTVTNANYASVQNLLNELQNSIRPMIIDNMTLSGSSTSLTLSVNAHTYYQPGKAFSITYKEVN